MLFNPKNLILKEGSFKFGKNVSAYASKALNKPILKEFWNLHTYKASEIEITESDEIIFKLGSAEALNLDGHSYAINVEKDGICITAENEKSLVNGFVTLLDRIRLTDTSENAAPEIKCCEIKETPLIKNRMVHFCVFPDTELWELEKFVRLCGALKYSHLVLEFWGMFKYDCLAELSWKHGFTKEQLSPIIRMARDLGIEVIPMFNHWGHASASRAMHGKHVVLDQNPSLQALFSEDGWCWNIKDKKVKKLLSEIRGELMELCGDGEYFHIGCDEAYNFEFNKENAEMICAYLNEVSEEVSALGRRAIIWGDMFLYKHAEYNPLSVYSANSPSEEFEKSMLDMLDRKIVIADWQYYTREYPIETSLMLKAAGFDVLTCPWDEAVKNGDACANTVKNYDLYGLMHTTWHTLSSGTPHVVRAAISCWEDLEAANAIIEPYSVKAAAALRKVYFAEGDYTKSGWAKYEIGVRT